MDYSRKPQNTSEKPVRHKLKKSVKTLTKVRIKKMHLEYIAGLLSIPLIVTGLIINFTNLHNKNNTKAEPTPVPQVIIVSGKPQQPAAPTINTAAQACQKSVGPISITSPEEGETVEDNPVCVTIEYSDTNYCSVVWSYRINNGPWSDYNNNAPCLYNMPNGNVKFDLRVNSTVSSDTKTLTRNFVYSGGATHVSTPTPQPTTPIASSSASQ